MVPRTFWEAQEFCKRNFEELSLKFVNNQLLSIICIYCIVITILGTKSTKSKNQIIWVDKSPMCYSNWNRGEPNGDGWIGIEMTKWGGWNDIPIFTRRTFMCQTKG